MADYQSPRNGKRLGVAGHNSYRTELRWLMTNILGWRLTDEWLRVLKKERPNKAGKYVTAEEFEAFLDQVLSFARRLAYQMIYIGGFRPHELLSIRPTDITFIDDDLAEIALPEENPKVPSGRNKTGGRLVVLRGSVVTELRYWTNHQLSGDEEYLFSWSHGSLSTMFSRDKSNYLQMVTTPTTMPMESIGVTTRVTTDTDVANNYNIAATNNGHGKSLFRLYDFRHSAATNFAREGLSDQLIRKVMGWSPSSKMFSTYIHLSDSHLREFLYPHNHHSSTDIFFKR